jgi:hypothetical protein
MVDTITTDKWNRRTNLVFDTLYQTAPGGVDCTKLILKNKIKRISSSLKWFLQLALNLLPKLCYLSTSSFPTRVRKYISDEIGQAARAEQSSSLFPCNRAAKLDFRRSRWNEHHRTADETRIRAVLHKSLSFYALGSADRHPMAYSRSPEKFSPLIDPPKGSTNGNPFLVRLPCATALDLSFDLRFSSLTLSSSWHYSILKGSS